jgi:hypothetical protein
MDNLFLAEVEDPSVAEHPCGASALLDVVVAVEVEQAVDADLVEFFAEHHLLLSVYVCIIQSIVDDVNQLAVFKNVVRIY